MPLLHDAALVGGIVIVVGLLLAIHRSVSNHR
jgi:hypothetical protein